MILLAVNIDFLLVNLTKTSSEEFNRKIFNLFDLVKNMDYKHRC
jgi:hypothetical protein